jgi:hypothetical protein
MLQSDAMVANGRGWGDLASSIAGLGRGFAHALSGLAEQRAAVAPRLARGDVRAIARPSDLFAEGIRENSNLELDWLWLYAQVTSPAERRYCLERVLAINPHSEIGRDELAKLPPARP